TIPPGLPPPCLDPDVIGRFFRLPVAWRHPMPPGIHDTEFSERQRQRQEPRGTAQGHLLRLRECVRLAGHSESTLRRAIRDGRLKAHTIGRGRKRPTYGILRGDL